MSAALKTKSDLLDKILAATPPDVSGRTDAEKLVGMMLLVNGLASAIEIAYHVHYHSEPEPYPGACEKVLQQALMAVQQARVSNLIGTYERG